MERGKKNVLSTHTLLNVEQNLGLKTEDASYDETSNDEVEKKDIKRRIRKKRRKTKKHHNNEENKNMETTDTEVEVEYIPEKMDITDNYADFKRIFDRFKLETTPMDKSEALKHELATNPEMLRQKYSIMAEQDEEKEELNVKDTESKPKLSKKKLKKATRLSVAELKQLVHRADIVEIHDVNSTDPKLLVTLKATRNTVPVPRHWCAKRKYLAGKCGLEKPAFELPDFIRRTGISEMRGFLQEKEAKTSLKKSMREKIRPKMGKINIDYQKLHDAFFRWQTKPKLSIHGDLYYEGKEFEARMKDKKPGILSEDLRIALGMPTGINADKVPPPWLIAMQRYGPPPAYPSLKIAGLNAPIPENCSFGYHAGGWGKPPVDEFGRPLYGDVFASNKLEHIFENEDFDRFHWGEIEPAEYPEEAPSEESEAEEEVEPVKFEEQMVPVVSGIKTPMEPEGIVTPGEISEEMELRKKKIEAEMEEEHVLYKILPEKPVEVGPGMMGTTKVYDLKEVMGEVNISLKPEELEIDSEMLKQRYKIEEKNVVFAREGKKEKEKALKKSKDFKF